MILVYVAGPFSATKDEIRRIEERTHTRAEFDVEVRKCVDANIVRAVARGLEVARIGLFPVMPHANTAHPDFEKVQPYPFWIDGTMELLFRSDVLVTVPGWEVSSGARGEVNAAAELRMPVFHEIARLEAWKRHVSDAYFTTHRRQTRVLPINTKEELCVECGGTGTCTGKNCGLGPHPCYLCSERKEPT